MAKNKVKSFTLPELLVVMIITAIIIGIAFSVLRFVQNEIAVIQKNFDKNSSLALFEQRLWQDFNTCSAVRFNEKENNLLIESEMDTIVYSFQDNFVLRDKDTLKLKLKIDKLLLEGKKIQEGAIDAVTISGEAELPQYAIFVSKKNDINFFMNQEDGL